MNIIIPTDFSITTLAAIQKSIEMHSSNQDLKITLVHGYQLSDSITDLLFHSKSALMERVIPTDFKESLEVIKNNNPLIQQAEVEFFHGWTKRGFKQLCDRLKVDQIVIPSNEPFKAKSRSSFDLRPFCKVIQLQVDDLNLAADNRMDMNCVSGLIFNELQR